MTDLEALRERVRVASGPRWVHFSKEPVTLRSVAPASRPNGKPVGLWLSDEADEQSWSKWCADEDWGLGPVAYEVAFALEARLLRLSSAYEIDAFTDEYAMPSEDRWHDFTRIDWPLVGREWQGILITPYIWQRRLDGRASDWYHGWDCASGCIWDTSAIASLSALIAQQVEG